MYNYIRNSSAMTSKTFQITLLADEWKSSKGGLSTMNRELAIQLAKHPNVSATFFVPKCTEDDKKAASSYGINIVEAKERYGYEDPVDWLSFPPRDFAIDIIIGHGVKLGKQAQVIKESHQCTWVQVVHTAPEELSMFKSYSNSDNPISKGDKKQWAEVKLCQISDLVVAVGPKLNEIYSAYLTSSGKQVFNLTPGIFTELSTLDLSTKESKKFRVLLFGRGDSEDFELKGFDIAAKAVAALNDRSYHLVFVGATSGKEGQVAEKLLEQGLSRRQLTVKGYIENREDLVTLLPSANLAIIPSRTEGFGLTALEALSAGLPFLVSQNSGFGEALQEIPSGTSWIIDSDDPGRWAEAIKGVRERGRETALKECQVLRKRYAEKYSWKNQCNDLVEMMLTLINDKVEMPPLDRDYSPERKQVDGKPGKSSTLTGPLEVQSISELRLREDSSLTNSQGAGPKKRLPTSTRRTNSKGGSLKAAFSQPFEAMDTNTPSLNKKTTESEESRDTSKSANTKVSYLQSMGKEIIEGCAHETRLEQENSVSLRQSRTFTDRVFAEPCDSKFRPADVTASVSEAPKALPKDNEEVRIKELLDDKGVIPWWMGNNPQTQNPKRTCSFSRSKTLTGYDGATAIVSDAPKARPINPEGFCLVLKTRLHHGKISLKDEDVEVELEGRKLPPEIVIDLMKKWQSTAEAELLVYRENKTGYYKTSVHRTDSKASKMYDNVKATLQNVCDYFSSLGNV